MKENCDACGQPAEREMAWLIEGDGVYWDGHGLDTRGFTRKVDDAVRFARSQDADAVKFWLLPNAAFALRTTLHCWIQSVHR